MDNGFDELDEPVTLSPSGRKVKRKSNSYSRNVAKRIRHSEFNTEPSILCSHNNKSVCLAALLTDGDIQQMHDVMYAVPDKVKQDALLLSYLTISGAKRRRASTDSPRRRETTIKYSVMKESKERIPVCKATFMSIFCVTKGRLNTIATHWMAHGVPLPERRGGDRSLHRNHGRKDAVRNHIQKFTCRASHYARRGAPGRKYLPSDLSVRKMHQMFERESHLQISYALYYSVFMYDFNLGFGHPSKDTCSTCLKYRLCMKNPEITDEAKRTETALYAIHRRRARQFYEDMNDVDDSFTICFDVMENQVLPKTSVGQAYNSRQLYLYVFGVVRHHGRGPTRGKEDVHLFVWAECENKKDSNMIASALRYYLSTIVGEELRDYQTLRLFSDSCYGQNKNINMLAMLFALKHQQFNHMTIKYTFPVRGHSFLPADRVFGRLSQDIKKTEAILLPSEYFTIMRKHGNVHVYGDTWQCFDFKAEATEFCSSTRSFKISNARVVQIDNDKLKMKQSYNGEFSTYPVLKRRKCWALFEPKETEDINCVSDAKRADVFQLLTTIGASASIRSFYESWLSDAKTADAGVEDSTDEEDD